MAAYLCQAGEVVLQDEAGEEAREVVYVEGVGAVWAVEVGAWGEEVGATVVVVVTAVVPASKSHTPCLFTPASRLVHVHKGPSASPARVSRHDG